MNPQINKIVLLGEKGVGKSCLVFRLCKDRFKVFSETTIGAAFVSYKIKYKDQLVPINIWDTAGHNMFNHLLPLYLRNVDVALICFQHPNLKKIQNYVNIVKDVDPSIKIFLVITKIDLWADHTLFPKVFEYASLEDLKTFKTSSISGEGVQELFNSVAEEVVSIPEMNIEDLPLSSLTILPKRCCS